MRWQLLVVGLAMAGIVGLSPQPWAAEPEAARRGEQALLGRSFSPPVWSRQAYDNVWQQWEGGLNQPPAEYAAAFRERYGLHPAPYPNGGLPMGMRPVTYLL